MALESVSALILDDNAHMRGLVRVILTSFGMRRIEEAADGNEAIAHVAGGDIDIAFAPSVKLSGGGAYTITTIPTNTEIELSGNGITGPPNTVINPLDMSAIDATSLANNITFDATALANNVYRYYVDASKFQVSGTGVVTILVKAGAVVDSATSGNSNRATTQSFTVQGTTVHVAGPADGGRSDEDVVEGEFSDAN